MPLKSNWQLNEVVMPDDMNAIAIDVNDHSTRLNSNAYLARTLNPGMQTISVSRDTPFKFANAMGRMLLNLLGRSGNFDIALGWTVTGGTLSIARTNFLYGQGLGQLTLTASTGKLSRAIPTTIGAYYIAVADIRMGNATSGKVNVPGASVGRLVTSSTFGLSYVPFTATAPMTAIEFSVTGTNGQTAFVDGFRVYEITQAQYNAIASLTVAEVGQLYPYTDGFAGVKTPYAIKYSDAAKTSILQILAFDCELLSGPRPLTDADNDTLVVNAQGKVIHTSKWVKRDLTGDFGWRLPPDGNRTGYKKIFINQTDMSEPVLATKFDGELLLRADGSTSDYGPNKMYVNLTSNVIELSITNADSGWADSYTPTTSEIKAFMWGWRMFADGQDALTGQYASGTKKWVRIGYTTTASIPPEAYTTSIPNTIGFIEYATPYTLLYKRIDTQSVEVTVSGSLVLTQGNNYIEVGSGMVLREKVNPSLDSAWNINNGSYNGTSPYAGGLASYKVKQFIDIYRSGVSDIANWTLYGTTITWAGALAQQFPRFYNQLKEYTITYFTLTQFTPVALVGTLPGTERSIINELLLQQSVQNEQIGALAIKNGSTKVIPWVSMTLVNGAIPYPVFADYLQGLYVRRVDNTLYLTGLIKSVPSDTVIAVLPLGLRPMYSMAIPLTYIYNGSTTGMAGTARMSINVDGGITITVPSGTAIDWISCTACISLT